MIEQGCIGDCSDLLQNFRQKCHAMFPLATVFQDQAGTTNDPSTFNHLNDSIVKSEGQITNGPVGDKFQDATDDIME